MSKYPAIIGILAASLYLWIGTAGAAHLPEGLPDLLKSHNFNIYPAPCPANNMVLRDLGGNVVDLNALRGKVVILNFWKIDCQPCSIEKPILEQIHRKYSGRGLEIVAVNLFDDHGRVKSYAKRHGFGYRFCGDPENRFTVRKQSLGGGTPSTFIVNSKSEAIYEVPGVPTTYLIDRTGQVIGNGVGMVNWAEGPLEALIESLLGPPSRPASQNNYAFSDVARQGPVADPTIRQAGPRRTNENPSSPADRQVDAPPVAPSASDGARDVRPPAAPDPAGTHSVSTPDKKPARTGKELGTKQRRTEIRELHRTQSKPNRKAQAVKNSSTPRPEYGKPKLYRSPAEDRGNPSPVLPASPPMAQGAGGTLAPPMPGVPPAAGSPMPSPPPDQSAGSALPAAMPYTPPNISTDRKPAPRPFVPDDNGQIMAEIPTRAATPPGKDLESPRQSDSAGSPYARPRMPAANPIDSFILDSFEGGAPQRQTQPPQALYPQSGRDGQSADADPHQAGGRQESGAAPASSLLGQLSHDVQSLGEGIKQTFSGWWPGK
ncbi:MAG: redoxin domain-containing protein [Pseudomonadota bacterium]